MYRTFHEFLGPLAFRDKTLHITKESKNINYWVKTCWKHWLSQFPYKTDFNMLSDIFRFLKK